MTTTSLLLNIFVANPSLINKRPYRYNDLRLFIILIPIIAAINYFLTYTGGGIGAACELGYFPDKGVYFFLAINIGTSINSPILNTVEPMRDEMLDVLTQ